jgi:Zn finger protein HypA/HybF involved in hydrogenase expression
MITLNMEMSERECPRCKAKAEEVINVEEVSALKIKKKRVGWYCVKCHHFEKAILRELRL